MAFTASGKRYQYSEYLEIKIKHSKKQKVEFKMNKIYICLLILLL